MSSKDELERKKRELIAKGVGYIIGYLFAAIVYVGIKVAINFGIVALFTYAIFWCFGWEWNIFIAIGIYLLACFIRLLLSKGRK